MSGRPRPIVIVGERVLHHPAAPVVDFDTALSTLIEDMFATMYLAQGVGLAAPQIGVSLALFVYDCHDDTEEYRKGHVVNPVITTASSELEKADEGCLSVPGPYASVERPVGVTVAGVDKHGKPVSVSGHGFLARCLIHETEHLAGTLYIDHLNRRRRSRVLAAIEPYPWNAPLPSIVSS